MDAIGLIEGSGGATTGTTGAGVRVGGGTSLPPINQPGQGRQEDRPNFKAFSGKGVKIGG